MTESVIERECKKLMCDEESTTAAMLTLLSNPGRTVLNLKRNTSGMMEWFARENDIVFETLINTNTDLLADTVIDYVESCLHQHGFVAVSLKSVKSDECAYGSWLHHSFVLVLPKCCQKDPLEECLTVDAYAGATQSRTWFWKDWRPSLRKLVGCVEPGKTREKLWIDTFGIPTDKVRFVTDGTSKSGLEVCVFY